MEQLRFQRHLGSRRAAAEKIHLAAFARQPRGRFPCLRFSHRFDHQVEAAAAARVFTASAKSLRPVMSTTSAPSFAAAASRSGPRPATVTAHCPCRASAANINPIGPLPMTSARCPGRGCNSSQPCATQASGSVSAASANAGPRFEPEEVLPRDAGRDDHRFRISAIEKEQIVAEIFPPLLAIAATPARRGIARHHRLARAPVRHARPQFAYAPGQFMSKDRRRGNHFRMIPALEHLQVRPASQRGFDGDAHLARSGAGAAAFPSTANLPVRGARRLSCAQK